MSDLSIFLFLAAIIVLSALYTRLRKKVGSSYVQQKLQTLNEKEYKIVSSFQLPEAERLDHVVVSIYGVFLIKRENYNGSIYGKETDEEWLFQVKKKQTPFINPLPASKQTKQHVAEYLQLDEKYITPIVAFSNKAILAIDPTLLKTKTVVLYDEIVARIASHKTPRLSKEQVTKLTEKLQEEKKAHSK
ncbi:nuclease-related domain-containing protein [Paraliobacillus sediminis]|uniref:nuclease-related domain-containing protein n=1 Tax=Paraliobacillus sediminis TaxID=1885916 RepID=UPI000E3CBE6B|nr:nuclease-related domain-containing protein [Paraliobacillus sediminis]